MPRHNTNFLESMKTLEKEFERLTEEVSIRIEYYFFIYKDLNVTSQLTNFLESMKILEKEFERLTERGLYIYIYYHNHNHNSFLF